MLAQLGELSSASFGRSELAAGNLETLEALRRRPTQFRDPLPDSIAHHAPASEFELDEARFGLNLRSARRGAAALPAQPANISDLTLSAGRHQRGASHRTFSTRTFHQSRLRVCVSRCPSIVRGEPEHHHCVSGRCERVRHNIARSHDARTVGHGRRRDSVALRPPILRPCFPVPLGGRRWRQSHHLAGPPGFHTTARELQTCTFERTGASNTTKIPRKRPKEREKRRKNCGGREKKKRKNLGPLPSGPHPFSPHPSGPHSPPPPPGPHSFRALTKTKNWLNAVWPNSAKQKWPKQVWPNAVATFGVTANTSSKKARRIAADPEAAKVWKGSEVPPNQQGLKILGAPFGHWENIAAQLERSFQKQETLIQRIPLVPDLQAAWLILLPGQTPCSEWWTPRRCCSTHSCMTNVCGTVSVTSWEEPTCAMPPRGAQPLCLWFLEGWV